MNRVFLGNFLLTKAPAPMVKYNMKSYEKNRFIIGGTNRETIILVKSDLRLVAVLYGCQPFGGMRSKG